MTIINMFSALRPHFKSIQDDVVSFILENKVAAAALAALALLALAFGALSFTRKKDTPQPELKNATAPTVKPPSQEEQKNTSGPIEQLETAVNQKGTAVKNIEQENEILKKRLAEIEEKMSEPVQSKSQPTTTISPSVQNDDLLKKLKDKEDQITTLTQKLDDAEKKFQSSQQTGNNAYAILLRQKKALEVDFNKAKQQPGSQSQSQEDIDFLKQVKVWLNIKNLGFSSTLYNTLNEEAKKVYMAIIRANELNKILKTKLEDLDSYVPSKGMEKEVTKLIQYIKSLVSENNHQKNQITTLEESEKNLKEQVFRKKSGNSSIVEDKKE